MCHYHNKKINIGKLFTSYRHLNHSLRSCGGGFAFACYRHQCLPSGQNQQSGRLGIYPGYFYKPYFVHRCLFQSLEPARGSSATALVYCWHHKGLRGYFAKQSFRTDDGVGSAIALPVHVYSTRYMIRCAL